MASWNIPYTIGIASVLSVIVLGDESGYTQGETQKIKLAAIGAEREIEEAPPVLLPYRPILWHFI